jgi:hypothetical protein
MIAPPDLTVDQLAAIEAAGWIYRGSNREWVHFARPSSGLSLTIQRYPGPGLTAVIKPYKAAVGPSFPTGQLQPFCRGRGAKAAAKAHALSIFDQYAGALAEHGIELATVAVWMARGAVVAGGYEAVPHDSAGEIDWCLP